MGTHSLQLFTAAVAVAALAANSKLISFYNVPPKLRKITDEHAEYVQYSLLSWQQLFHRLTAALKAGLSLLPLHLNISL